MSMSSLRAVKGSQEAVLGVQKEQYRGRVQEHTSSRVQAHE